MKKIIVGWLGALLSSFAMLLISVQVASTWQGPLIGNGGAIAEAWAALMVFAGISAVAFGLIGFVGLILKLWPVP